MGAIGKCIAKKLGYSKKDLFDIHENIDSIKNKKIGIDRDTSLLFRIVIM